MKLADFRPEPSLVTQVTDIQQPRFRVIDAHNHTGDDFGGGWYKRPVAEFIDVLDQAHVDLFVDLDGGWGEEILHHRLDKFKTAVPDRYMVFGGVDWAAWPEQGDNFGEWAAARFRDQVARGAQGLKIWKPLGLHVRDQHDKLVAVDDVRLTPLWETAGELNVPVLVHVADPVAFFDPLTPQNERWEELQAHPDWQFPSPPFPPFLTIMEQFARVVRRHKNTTFIGAHVGCYAENLGWVSNLLDECPNFNIDFSARIGELGRQPYAARRFFIKYADRILFGADQPADLAMYQLHYRFLETDDEYFNYGLSPTPAQGRWRVYGLHLPDDVLKKIYHENARRLLNFG